MAEFRMNTRSVVRDLNEGDATHANSNSREQTKTGTPSPIDKKRGKSSIESETDEEEELLRQSEALDKALHAKRAKLKPSIETETDDEEELLRQSAALDKALRIKRTKEHMEQTRRHLEGPPIHQAYGNSISGANSTATPTVLAPQHFVSRTHLEVPKYDGESYAKLKEFLMDLEVNFHLSPGSFPMDHMKVGYASSGLRGGVKERWIKYAGDGGRVKFYDLTWEDFVKWLHNQATDENTRCLNASKKLTKMRQEEGQSFRKYYDKWAAEESEYPDVFPEKLSICMFLNSLQPELRKLIVSKQFPKDWNSLLGQGMSAENANGFDEKHKPAEKSRTKRQRSESRSRSRSPRAKKDRSNFEQSPITCYKCGRKGHISLKCWEPDCETCGNPRHTTATHNGGSRATANMPSGSSRDTANTADANATPISTVRR